MAVRSPSLLQTKAQEGGGGEMVDPTSFDSLGSTAASPYGLDEDPRDVYVAGQAMKFKETLLRIILPSAAAASLALFFYTPFCLFLKSIMDTGELSILANDSSHGLIVFLF